MRWIFLSLLCLLCAKSGAALAGNAPDSHAAHGIHGMVLFGDEHLFASHMPTWQAPHNFQVILRLRIDDRTLRKQVRNDFSNADQLTIAPETFDLNRLAPGAANPLKKFRADLYEGHFERGGSLFRAGVVFEVDKVILFRPLRAEEAAPANAELYAFGVEKERYLAHHISGRPGFDRIFRVVESSPGRGTRLVNVGVADRAEEVHLDATAFRRALNQQGIDLLSQVWFEEDDLR
jgi:hypothetical protein